MFVSIFTHLIYVVGLVVASMESFLTDHAGFYTQDPVSEEVVPPVQIASPFNRDLKPISTPPERLIIPSARIDINLVPLGVDAEGRLDVPKNPSQGGWYFRSALAGEKGTVLIDAHYDDVHGRPAAFYNLKRVKVGDKLILVDSYGRQFPYRVTEVNRIGLNNADRIQQLSSDREGAFLTLITCGGRWLPGASTYSERLIVRSVLEK